MTAGNTYGRFDTIARAALLAMLLAVSVGCSYPCDSEIEIATEECQRILGVEGSTANGSVGEAVGFGTPGHWDELDWTALHTDDVVGPVGNASAFVITLTPPLVGYACLDPIWEEITESNKAQCNDECIDECEGDNECMDECTYWCLDWEVVGANFSVHPATPQYDLLGYDGCPVHGFDRTVNCTTEFASTQKCDFQNYFLKDGSTPFDFVESISEFAQQEYEQCEFDDGLVIDVLANEPCDEPSF